jgi:ribonuclease HII
VKKTQSRPDFTQESEIWSQGFNSVVGVDEAGRGSLSGPVVAGAVIIPRGFNDSWLYSVRDSKQLSANRRESMFSKIKDSGIPWSTGIVENSRIDEIGILNATIDAMLIAITNLGATPDFVLIDAVEIDVPYLPSKSIIRGDQISVSIAAGSIVAKVTRDRLMIEYDQIYPEYGFANNKGYPTEFHRKQLMELGPCQIHRFSFAPVHNACRGT